MTIKIHHNISEIPAYAWNKLVHNNYPFLRHEWLQSLEKNNCVGEEFGWLPCHIALYDNEQLIGAMPLYEKHNSYGEFVFDHAWAEAWQRAGFAYFPKFVCAIPYTPANGQRILVATGYEDRVFPTLLNAAQKQMQAKGGSGLHILFPTGEEHAQYVAQSCLVRHDCQFHWHNQGYQDFDDFLSRLTAKKRKNIRQERRRVRDANVQLRVLNGHQATVEDWQHFSHFYQKTFDEKWGIATLNETFFSEVAQQLPEQIVLVLADREDECIAGALMYRSDTTLYGRHWGCIEEIDCLHFEACYYQGIEYCIQEGLQCFEPGAQGQHKIARGFLPTRTQSAHWMQTNPFQAALEKWVKHEQESVAAYIQQMQGRSPYRQQSSE